MKWWLVYCAAGVGTAVSSFVLTFVCRGLASRLGFLDRPLKEAHKLHRKPIPVLGGLSMFLAWAATIVGGLVFSRVGQQLISPEITLWLPGIQTKLAQLFVIVAGALALVALGLADDRWSLDAATKFAGQFCIAGAVACYGIRVTMFWDNQLVVWGITTFWILFIINAINFLDNMDGLAAGTATIAAFLFMMVAGIREQYFVAVLAAVTVGAAAGFLMHNRPPATIFMGDAGSHFLGYLLAVIGALTTYYTPSETPTPAPILIPLFILGVPIFDLLAVVVVRLHHGKPIYVGDHTHMSHRFADMGFSRAWAVLLVYLLTFAIGAAGLTLLWLPGVGVLVVLMQCGAMFALITILQYGSRLEKKDNAD